MGRGNSPITYTQQILPDAAVTLKKMQKCHWTEREQLKEGKSEGNMKERQEERKH